MNGNVDIVKKLGQGGIITSTTCSNVNSPSKLLAVGCSALGPKGGITIGILFVLEFGRTRDLKISTG